MSVRAAASICCALFVSGAFAQQPPVAAKKPHVTEIRGQKLDDDYYWLRDKKNPEVLAHLEAENAYAEAVMKGTDALQQKLYDEQVGHMKEAELEVPRRSGDYYYYTRTAPGKQYEIYARRKGSLAAPEEIYLDVNELAKGLSYIDVGSLATTPDHNLLAYSTDTTGEGVYNLVIKDLRTGKLLPDTIANVDTAVWAKDGKTLFYLTDDATQRPDRVFRHVLGGTKDELVYQEPDAEYRVRLSRTRDREMILIDSYSKTANEIRFLPSADPSAPLRVIAPRRAGHTYALEHRGDSFYIRTNDRAPNFRLVSVKDSAPSMEHWREVIPARPDVELFEVNVFRNHMAVSENRDGIRAIRIVDLRTGKSTPIVVGDEPIYNLSRDANDFDTTKFRYRYNALLSPEGVYEFDLEKHFNTLLKQTEVPHYDRTQYAAERIYATASDGAKIPLSIVYKKPFVRDGKRPVHLYAYGAYGTPIWPFFVRAQLPLLDRGVVYVVAHVRGGGDKGPAWREAGRMLHKRNTFTDFIAAAEQLVKAKYTSADRIAISSGSAGGLILGFAMNERPDLFKVVVGTSAFVDILNTMLDPSLPLVTNEYKEWGNPNDQGYFDYIRSYSPYDNVKRQAYPAALFQVSLNDPAVGFWEGAKFVAKLRELKTDSNPLLLRVLGAGHAGAPGRYESMKQLAFLQAFELRQLGIDQ